jgi:hypothetical protein
VPAKGMVGVGSPVGRFGGKKIIYKALTKALNDP